jgi:hypothetical protein
VDVVSRGDQPTWAGGSGRHATVCNISRSHNSFIDPWPGLEGGVATTVVLRLPHAQSIRSIRYGVVTQHCRGFPTKVRKLRIWRLGVRILSGAPLEAPKDIRLCGRIPQS